MLTSICFNVRDWADEEKTTPKTFQSWCRYCKRIDKKKYDQTKFPSYKRKKKNRRARQKRRRDQAIVNRLAPSAFQARRNQQARVRYRDRRDPRLPVEPFQDWLRVVVMENSIAGVARNAGVDMKRVSTLIAGEYYSSPAEKWYPIKHVRYSVVERFAASFGIPVTNIYHFGMIDRYRAPKKEPPKKRKRRK